MKKLPVFSYILIPLLLLIVLSIGMVSIYSLKALSDFIYKEVGSSLEEEARLIHNLIPAYNSDSESSYQEVSNRILDKVNIRLTIIREDGVVLSDTHEDFRIMENHSGRPEVVDALQGRIGLHTRYSKTLSRHMLYVAIPPGDKHVIVRTALSVDHIRDKFLKTFSDIIVFSVFILLIAVLTSIYTANSFSLIIRPIKNISAYYAKGDFSKKLTLSGPIEIVQLKSSINTMGEQLNEIIDTVSFQKNELRAMLNSMSDAVIKLDKNTHILEVNPAAEVLLGKKFSSLKGIALNKIIDNQDLLSLLNDSLVSGEPRERTLDNLYLVDQYLQVHITPITGSEKQDPGLLVVFHNITRVKQLENMRKDFVANVSHELKTPVTLINGFVETLLDGAINDEKKSSEFLHVIGRHSRRISNIIDDLLVLSNIEDKGTNISTEMVTLFDILFSAYTSALTASEKAGIQISVDCDEKIKIRVNPVLLEQAVLNLVYNAVKYAGEGAEVKIKASVIRDEEVKIEVTDNGIGISSEQLDRIFERFYRVNRQQSKKLGGTGLGLSIVKHIALAHNGRVDVESSPGKGSSFRIFLPLR